MECRFARRFFEYVGIWEFFTKPCHMYEELAFGLNEFKALSSEIDGGTQYSSKD